jgi:hypothetical protein
MPDRWVNPEGWGPPPPPPRPGWDPPPPTRPPGRRRGRRWPVLLPAAALVTVGAVAAALTTGPDPRDAAPGSMAPSTATAVLPTVATTLPTTSTAPPTTVATVEVPRLVGMSLDDAKEALADRGLRVKVRYRSTGRHPAGTVITQSRRGGAGVLPDSRVTLVVAKTPPPPTTAPPPPSTAPSRDCDPSYPGVCLDPEAVDYDCAGGSGNGPEYVEGPIRVRPPDPFDLDREGDGWGCERG